MLQNLQNKGDISFRNRIQEPYDEYESKQFENFMIIYDIDNTTVTSMKF